MTSLPPSPSTVSASAATALGITLKVSSPRPRNAAIAVKVPLSKVWGTVPLPKSTTTVLGAPAGSGTPTRIESPPAVPVIVRVLFATDAKGIVAASAALPAETPNPAASAMHAVAAKADRKELLKGDTLLAVF